MSDYQTERLTYINRLRRQSAGIDNILSINSLGMIPPETEEKLRVFGRRAKILRRKLESEEFEIAIVGKEKSGKSTFVNALMGANVLPTREARCTYTATSIRYGAEDKAVVRFFSRETFEKNFRKNLEKMGVPHGETLLFGTLNLETYRSLYQEIDEASKKAYGKDLNLEFEEILSNKESIQRYLDSPEKRFVGRSELESDDFTRFIIDPGRAYAVEEIILHTSQLAGMPNAVIYDVPGFNSPTELHKVQTIRQMRACDAILYVARADEPSITRESVEIFETEIDEDNLRLRDKLFVFANKADRADTLDENLRVLKSDLKRFNILREEHFNRIVAGSARAKLQRDGILRGDEALQTLERRNQRDGMDEIRSMLEKYNRMERVRVMQKRVDNLQRQIRDEFQALFDKTETDSLGLIRGRREDIALERMDEMRCVIPRGLEDYRAELRARVAPPSYPLTDKLLSGLVDEITSQTLGVTDEELNRSIKHVDASSPNPMRVDSDLRREKRQKIYDTFQRGILSLAEREHEECNRAILEIFARGCRITSENPHYETLMRELRDFVEKHRVTDSSRSYYSSLIYRFSDDLFQILLEYSFGDDARYNFFEMERNNFYSLAMFDENSVPDFSPGEQPLHRQILFHQRAGAGEKERQELIDELSGLVGKTLSDETVLYLDKLLKRDANAPDAIRNRLKNRKDCPEDYLQDILDDMTPDDQEEQSVKLNLQVYRDYFADRPPKTYETVRAEINADIDVLHDILKTAIVHAICLEKPFYELERGVIANLIDALQVGRSDFRDFVRRNIHLIAAEEYVQMDQEEQNRQTRESIQRQIEEILNDMMTAKKEDTQA